MCVHPRRQALVRRQQARQPGPDVVGHIAPETLGTGIDGGLKRQAARAGQLLLHPAQRLGCGLQLFGAELFHVGTPGLDLPGLSPEVPALSKHCVLRQQGSALAARQGQAQQTGGAEPGSRFQRPHARACIAVGRPVEGIRDIGDRLHAQKVRARRGIDHKMRKRGIRV
ncbi:hypothetical protein G6F57_019801 [Rhizopus arrhizus]|nr:hypothetical protein G6F57_019801 [Rhizopus arrhizus]